MWALATGGPFGTGLGLGNTRYLPAGHTDLILAAVGEELGAVGLVAVAVLFAIIAWRGFRIARHASSDYGFFLAMSHWQLGNKDEARRCYEKAVQRLGEPPGANDSTSDEQLNRIRAEAAELLGIEIKQ